MTLHIPEYLQKSKNQLKTAFSEMKRLFIIKKENLKNEEFYTMDGWKKPACKENC